MEMQRPLQRLCQGIDVIPAGQAGIAHQVIGLPFDAGRVAGQQDRLGDILYQHERQWIAPVVPTDAMLFGVIETDT